MTNIVILEAGTGGTLTANLLRRKLDATDHGLELRMVDVGRSEGAPARDIFAHELGRNLLGQPRVPALARMPPEQPAAARLGTQLLRAAVLVEGHGEREPRCVERDRRSYRCRVFVSVTCTLLRGAGHWVTAFSLNSSATSARALIVRGFSWIC